MRIDDYGFYGVRSEGEQGYSTDIMGYGQKILFDKLAEVTLDKDIANKNTKFACNTKVRINTSLEDLTDILSCHNKEDYAINRGEAKAILYDGWGVIVGTDILEGARYYQVEVGEDKKMYPLPERILEKF